MEDRSVAILVPSWDAYRDVWKPFFSLFFKYWPDCAYPLYLRTNYLSFEGERVFSIQIGDDIDYRTNLLSMLQYIPNDWIKVWVEDLLPNAQVDNEKVRRLINLAISKGLKFLRLSPGYYSLLSIYTDLLAESEEMGIVEIPQGARYRAGLTIGLWKKDILVNLLRRGETAWDFERKGTRRSYSMDSGFYCVLEDALFSVVNGIRNRKWTRETLTLFNQEGLLAFLKNRSVESWWFYIYKRFYTIFRYIGFRLYLNLSSYRLKLR